MSFHVILTVMKNNKLSVSVVTILLIGTSLLSAAVTKSLVTSQTPPSSSENTYNHISVSGTPINNGEFIFGGGTYRDVNLKLKINIPVGWSLGLGNGNGCICENEFELDPSLTIYSNNQAIPKNGLLTASDLIQKVRIDGTYYKGIGVTGNHNPHTSFEEAVKEFANSKDDKIVSIKGEDFLLANKYKAHRFDIEYKYNVSVDGEESKNSPMRFRTLIYIDHESKLYTVDVTNTDFYNSLQVQNMLNSVEFYQ